MYLDTYIYIYKVIYIYIYIYINIVPILNITNQAEVHSGYTKSHNFPINPTPSSVHQGYMEIRILGHVEGGKRCGGDRLMMVTMTHAS